ncbi:Fc.00g077770.m01.CDS01 [Cosmosporella sp. VM-42]
MEDSTEAATAQSIAENDVHDSAARQSTSETSHQPPAYRKLAPRSVNTPIPSRGPSPAFTPSPLGASVLGPSSGTPITTGPVSGNTPTASIVAPRPPPNTVKDDAEDQPYAVHKTPTPGSVEEPLDGSATPQTTPSGGTSKRPQKSSVTLPRRLTRADILTPERLKQQLIDLKLDALRLRADLVYTNDQVDGTFLFPWDYSANGPKFRGKGFYVFDGFDRTYFVPEDRISPVPPSRKALLDDVNNRRQNMEKMYHSGEHSMLFDAARTLLKAEVATTCQGEWEEDKNDPDAPRREWNDVKHLFNGSQLVDMIAKTRLINGKALLLGYYRINLLELTLNGKMATRRIEMPTGLDVASICERFDILSPPDSDHDKAILDAIHKKLNVVVQHGSEVGKTKAQGYLRNLNTPGWYGYFRESRSERSAWNFKLFAKEDYKLPPGKGPGKPGPGGGWIEIKDQEAVKAMEDGVRAGRHPVVVRKVRLRRMWPGVDELEKYLLPAGGEPELTEEQLKILDNLLEGQTEEQREHGRQLAAALKNLGGPTYRLEFAGSADTADQEDAVMSYTDA